MRMTGSGFMMDIQLSIIAIIKHFKYLYFLSPEPNLCNQIF
jgi:hypothetical protein